MSVRLIRCADKHAAASFFDRVSPAAVFIEPSFLNLSLIQKIKVRCQTDPLFRVYRIGPQASAKNDIFFHTIFDQPVPHEFEKKWPETLPLPDIVKLLVIDDEQEIGSMVRDYFEGRSAPAFEIRHALNGREGMEAIERARPDIIILDIKMPVMDGREFYHELKRKGINIPVIIFFDSISGEELREIRKFGTPPAAEKGSRAGALPGLMALIKKTIYLEGKN
ncbi:MAG: Response regulator MprA [Candidatus Omnitrophica bacterium ADurb.Bin277]|nr:MAG: Response regulator MprA [Candidatus Omnitrophica bacterium ADurb.Bin277]